MCRCRSGAEIEIGKDKVLRRFARENVRRRSEPFREATTLFERSRKRVYDTSSITRRRSNHGGRKGHPGGRKGHHGGRRWHKEQEIYLYAKPRHDPDEIADPDRDVLRTVSILLLALPAPGDLDLARTERFQHNREKDTRRRRGRGRRF